MCRYRRPVDGVCLSLLVLVVSPAAAGEQPERPEGALACRTLNLPLQSLLGPSALSPDGQFLVGLLPDKQRVGVWELASGRKVRSFRGAGPLDTCLAVSPDGSAVAVGTVGGRVVLCDLATGKERHAWQYPEQPLATALAFAPDGRTLAAALGPGGPVRLWNVRTGKEVRQLERSADVVSSLVFSPDGKMLAAVAPEAQKEYGRLWKTEGKELRLFRERITHIAFSADGQKLASADGTGTVQVWGLTEKQGARVLRVSGVLARHVAFSPDGRMVASWSDLSSPICLWEVASGQVALRFKMPAQQVRPLARSIVALGFVADGWALVAVGCEGTVVWWDRTTLGREGWQRVTKLRGQDLEDLWDDLASANAVAAHRAVWLLTAGHPVAVPFLQERLRTLETLERQIERAIKGLDAKRFAVRQRAARELIQLGESARPALRRVLLDEPSLEMRKRIEEILGAEEAAPRVPDQRLRVVRGVEALEQAASPEARRALEQLARAATESIVQTEAKHALARLGQPTRKP
jgi:hypothetical protein